jgi:RraA family protein
MPRGFRILPMPERAPASVVAALGERVAAHLSDCMGRIHSATGLRPMHRGARMVGSAYTVKVPPGDNLMVHKAIDMAAPGDVIVVDAGGVLEQAIIGEIMSSWAAQRGIAGMVIDGAVRDAAALAQNAFAVYAKGVTPRGPYKNGPGEINCPVAVGGMVVMPGDIVVGDEDGVVCVPKADAEEILAAALAQAEKEDAILADIRRGALDRAWVDETLRARGCTLP